MGQTEGWVLREVGKRDQAFEEAFLKKHYGQTKERFSDSQRKDRIP